MVVVDTNIISYLFLPTAYTKDSESLMEIDDKWCAPLLWRSELRNVLGLYLSKEIIDLATAMDIQEQAETMLYGNEFQVNSNKVLTLVNDSGCTAYDCEFIALAQSLERRLITTDRKLLRAFPGFTATAKNYVEGKI